MSVKSYRLALVELPRDETMARVTAFAADGSMVGYAVPYQGADVAWVVTWYRPDEVPTQPVAAGTVPGGVQGSAPVSLQFLVGPFGTC